LGALGKVVAEGALSRGARVAGIDHAESQLAATAERIELGGVDLTDAAQAKKTIDAAAAHFGVVDARCRTECDPAVACEDRACRV
jgi:NADP-dependent 3-hydroxy acid dehydrogenase YdfG